MLDNISDNLIIGIIVGLLVIIAVLFVRIKQYKKQVRLFAKATERRLDVDVATPVRVEYFDKEIIELANALNKYTDELKEKNLLLEEERQQIKNLIAGISHDFRTPLTAARGYMQLIEKNEKLSEKNKEYLKISMDKLDYLRTLSDAFFEVSAEEAKDEAVQKEKLDFTKLLTEALLGQYEWISEAGLKTDFQIPEAELIVESNPEYLQRILENLFSNSRKYALSEISIGLSSNDDKIEFYIQNDLEHQDEIDVDRVFELFYRSSSRTKNGSGIGLYVVKLLADKLGHEVSAGIVEDKLRITIIM